MVASIPRRRRCRRRAQGHIGVERVLLGGLPPRRTIVKWNMFIRKISMRVMLERGSGTRSRDQHPVHRAPNGPYLDHHQSQCHVDSKRCLQAGSCYERRKPQPLLRSLPFLETLKLRPLRIPSRQLMPSSIMFFSIVHIVHSV